VQGSGTEIILVGAGDPTLAGPQAVGAFAPGYPDPAKLSDLAAQTASALHAKGIAAVSVGYDATLFTGASTAIGWKPSYITDGNVAPVSALEVDEGRVDLQRRGRSADPAMAAATAFATLLTTDGITVTGNTRPVRAGSTRPTLASVSAPPVADLVQRMLGRSDNDLAEALARHVAIAAGLPATFAGGAEAVEHVLGALGIDRSAFSLVDSSGLSAADQLRPAGLVQLLQVAMRPTHTEFAPMLAGLPVSGFSGTLEERFEGAAAMGGGVVRAKTGTLDGVVALAGYVDDAAGRTLVVAVVANGVALNATDMTEAALDRIMAGLATCGCQ
jgi:D-alanyl-D-alanine carboxypeptidase/D-alanyl-D-alanine-endopeptidase (penicillin-binding protein 4)